MAKPQKHQNHRKVGTKWEKSAVELLKKKGYQILKQNFFSPFGEIDIIAFGEHTLCFVEVKFRSSDLEDALFSVGYTKQQRLKRCANHFLAENPKFQNSPIQFDVVGFCKQKTGYEVIHLKNCF